MSFVPTKFGSAVTFSSGAPGQFYSHKYDEQGRSDLIDAAYDWIDNNAESDLIRRIARVLLQMDGPSTDLYRRQTEERWIVFAEDYIVEARRVSQALTIAEKEQVSETWNPESSMIQEFQDRIDRVGAEEFRETLARALHDLLCEHDPSDPTQEPYGAKPGGRNRYQRHADALLAKLMPKAVLS